MLNRWLFTNLPTVRQVFTRISYDVVSILDRDHHFLLLNFGYVDLESGAELLQLSPEDEKQRYEIQLYHHIATTIPFNWEGLKVLEVSSGRGGGARYIKNRFHPESVVGADLCKKAVNFCNNYYSEEGLSFLHGDAEALEFPDESFDVVINVEASFYYPHIKRFFKNVVRVLKPNGLFLYADMRYDEELELWKNQLRSMGLEMLSEENITPNVIQALALDQDRRFKLIQEYSPRLLHRSLADLSGVTGAGLSQGSSNGSNRTYWSFVFHKNQTS